MQKPAEHSPKRAELMAPAGSVDAGYAAFHYGADSIYLGLKQFSARADAANFTPDELDAITAYAHSLQPRRKVFVTVNTLVLQDELSGLVEQLGTLADIGVDALIIQDLGVYRIAKKHFPELRLHASTQMAVHNRAGVEALKELGFARVTLARELTLDEIREIIEAVPGRRNRSVHSRRALLLVQRAVPLLFPPARTQRQPRPVRVLVPGQVQNATDGKEGFFFSMKDLALPEELAALRKAGVTSFKIEGRMKSPLYVAATTNYYRKLIDGNASPAERKNLEADIQTIFSRPWTELYTRSRGAKDVIDSETVGHRGTPIGTVDMVLDNRVLRFRSSRAIEVHDGLQIDIPGEAKPFGFPVDALRLAGEYKHTFEAPANTSIEVILPEEHPEIPARGDGLPRVLAEGETAVSFRSSQTGRVPDAPAAGRFDRAHAGPADRARAGRAGARNDGFDPGPISAREGRRENGSSRAQRVRKTRRHTIHARPVRVQESQRPVRARFADERTAPANHRRHRETARGKIGPAHPSYSGRFVFSPFPISHSPSPPSTGPSKSTASTC